METTTYINNMLRAIGDNEVKSNFEQRLMPQFEAYFPGAIEVVFEESLEVYVNDFLLFKNIIDFIEGCYVTGETMLGVDWVSKYARQESYVRQVIPFNVNIGQDQYVCPKNRY